MHSRSLSALRSQPFPCPPPASSRSRQRTRPVRAGIDRSAVRHRLDLEREARRQRVLGHLTLESPSAVQLPTRFALSERPPETLSRRCLAEWEQWGLAEAKLALFSSEATLRSKFGTGGAGCRRSATRAIDSIRSFAVPPLLFRQSDRLEGSWSLVETTHPERFGLHPMADVGRGVEKLYDRSPEQIDVQFVVRMFTYAKHYSETSYFADAAGARIGAFTEFGYVRIGGSNAIELQPTRFCLTIERDETEIETPAHPPRPLSLAYLDDDLMLEGDYGTEANGMPAWGRDHDVDLRRL